MSSSLPKRRAFLQKQNLNRLSNSKIISAYSGGNSNKFSPCEPIQPFLSSNIEEKLGTNTKRTTRLKAGRKHPMTVEFILSSKFKEPYSVRSTQQQTKLKHKKKKRDKNSHESSKFIIPIGQFSKSNSLIVFSEKDSTISGNLFSKDRNLFFSPKFTPSQAAILIQKTWRGYLTRKLLDQYITDQQSKLNSAIKRIRSKQESFVLNQERQDQIDFSSFSSINEETASISELRKYSRLNDQEQTNAKYYPIYTTSQQTSTKQPIKGDSPIHYKSFFKNHKTETDTHNIKDSKQPTGGEDPLKKSLTLVSSLYSYSFCNKFEESKILEFLQNEGIGPKIDRLNCYIESCYKDCRKFLKQFLQKDELDVEEMAKRNSKIKQIYDNSKIFLRDVLSQINAIAEDMQDITHNGFSSSSSSSLNPNEPRSQLFTIDMDEKEPQIPTLLSRFPDGQLKLQSYLNDLIEEYNQNSATSQLQFLCEILKVNSERGVKDIIERCLIQFTVEMITENIPMQDLNKYIYRTALGESKEEKFIKKWIDQINKWEMGTIQQVTQAMQSSSFINGQTSKSFINQEK